jgi:3-deoxy-D-manno-octulosonic-acid transferase
MLIRFFYTLVLTLAAPFLLFGLYKSKPNKPRFGSRWKEHFGLTPKPNSKQRPIWIHAVSVGESIAAIPLIKELKKQSPTQPILVTTTTSTGAAQIAKLGDLVEHRYMPIDFSFAVKGFLAAVNPQKMLIIETELWPNTLNLVNKAEVPITIVNARLSDKSCANYAKVQPLFNLMHSKLSNVLCQTEADAMRFKQLGVAEKKLEVTGSIKFDIKVPDNEINEADKLKESIGYDRPTWIAASTHEGEDEQILKVHRELLGTYPTAVLILVPRHPERFENVYQLCRQSSFNVTKRTSARCISSDTQIYLGDTMGEMLTLIGASDICFMGGSLIGNKVGGHNLLEPAILGKPSIIGPSYYNFSDITDSLSSCGGVKIVSQSSDISHSLITLFQNPYELAKSGEQAFNFVMSNQGAITKTINSLEKDYEPNS